MRTNIIKITNNLLSLSRPIKTFIAISIDFSCCVFSVWFSYYLRLGDLIPLSERGLDALAYSLIISFLFV